MRLMYGGSGVSSVSACCQVVTGWPANRSHDLCPVPGMCMPCGICLVVVVSSPHQSPVERVEKVWMFWLPTMLAGNLTAMRQLSFGLDVSGRFVWCVAGPADLSCQWGSFGPLDVSDDVLLVFMLSADSLFLSLSCYSYVVCVVDLEMLICI